MLLESVAVALGLAYLVLALRQNPWCWPAGIVSSLLYVTLMAETALYMEAGLQVCYVVLGIYGWWTWVRGSSGEGNGRPGAAGGITIHSWPWTRHLPLVLATLVLTGLSGFFLARLTPAAAPYLDSFVTWGALAATWLTARKVLETWHWWLVVDGLSLALYLNRGLYQTAALFAVYLVLVVLALRAWQRDLRAAPA